MYKGKVGDNKKKQKNKYITNTKKIKTWE